MSAPSPFDTVDLSYLATLTPEAFEAERNRLIANALIATPAPHRAACIKLQQELTEHRGTHSPTEHMAFIGAKLTENLENLSDAVMRLGHAVGVVPTVKPYADR
jgi:hypothetical protein